MRLFVIVGLLLLSGCRRSGGPIEAKPIEIIKQETKPLDLYTLTNRDRKNYSLKVTVGKPVLMGKECSEKDFYYREVKFTLTNNYKDTLKYMEWTCGEQIWFSDNRKVTVQADTHSKHCIVCDKTIISVKVIPPRKSERRTIYAYSDAPATSLAFRVGMILQRCNKWEDTRVFWSQHSLSGQTNNLIWSNRISLN